MENQTKEQVITELHRLRQELHELKQVERSHQRIIDNLFKEKLLAEATIDSLPGIFYLLDQRGRFVRWNENFEAASQFSTEEISRASLSDFFPSEDRGRLEEALQDIILHGKTTFEANLVAKDGSIKPYLFSGMRLELEDTRYIVGMGINILARKRVEEAFKSLVFNAPIGIFIIQDRKFRLINPAFQTITGYSEPELLGRNCLMLVKPEFKEKVRMNAVHMLKGKRTSPYEYEITNKKGETLFIMESVTSISFDGDRAVLGYFMDVTERAKIERQLALAQRMESIGILAGGIAHDFNNLLMAIMGYGEIMMLEAQGNARLLQQINEVMKAANRGTRLTNQLLAFSRKQILQFQVLDLNAVVTGIETMLRRLIGEDIELVTVLEPALGAVKVDPGQIEQIIMNLTVNARDAMPQGGKLTIETANVYLDETYARQHVSVTPGHYVMLAISDNGLGMDAETQARIFEPFFTTKEGGRGTGLGLATVYGIVKQSHGFIWVYSEPGQGTTFKIYFPRVEAAVEEIKPKVSPVTSLHGKETILVVEDDDILRRVISKSLQNYGYTVLEAGSGDEALSLCAQERKPIDLLITDVVMPQMSGKELAARLTSVQPHLKVLYMSGYTDNAIVHHGTLEAGINFLQKPVKAATLAAKVRELLDSPGKH